VTLIRKYRTARVAPGGPRPRRRRGHAGERGA
jgi:hypothetical protein